MTPSTTSAQDTEVVSDETLAALATIFSAMGRDDLRTRIETARVRMRRASTVVCVVGEFKQGKSSLVNGLLGQQVCPVDDDIATAAVTLVRHGEHPKAVARFRDDADPAAVEIGVDDVGRYVTEGSAEDGGRLVERVDISVPSPLLADGLAVVDTPGMGGLGAGHAAATLAFLPFADGLVFVSDASSELTASEVAFLRSACSLCPNVIMALTKTDISPAWRHIADLDRGHLRDAGLDVEVVAVSSFLRSAAFESGDRTINERSGYPALIERLSSRVIGPARADAGDRAATEARSLIDATTASLASERSALTDQAAHDRLIADAASAAERLDALRAGGARWNTVLSDRVSDLSSEVNHRFRGAIRELVRVIDEQIETLKTAEEWDGLARQLQTGVAEAVTDAFVGVELGRGAARDEIAEVLAADDVVGPTQARESTVFDPATFWRSRGFDPAGTGAGRAFKTSLTGLRGAQSGIMLLGVSTQFLPTAAAVFVATNPVLLGVGAAFGGMQLLEDRKRKVQMRRQTARTEMRQFADEIQFEMGNELTKALRAAQRDLRDEFVALIDELRQTWTSASESAQRAAVAGKATVDERLAVIDDHARRLVDLRDQIGTPR